MAKTKSTARGGETHQTASADGEALTTNHGLVIADNQNSLKGGPRGPVLLEDHILREKITHFDHERIPERVVHARGSGAHGYFQPTKSLSRLTRAGFLQDPSKKPRVFVRFSTVAGGAGSADTVRDVRGFAVKFYTEEGNWDLVGNNTPVFFVRDPYKFPDFIHTQKRDPKTNLRNPTAMWDFWSLSPESLHQVTILFSDRGLPKNYRQMHGFGSHTYSLINAANERVWVKFHFKSQQGVVNISDAESARTIGHDRESHQRDLVEAIERGDYPRWKVSIQVMTEEQARKTPYDPFDLTKVWPHGDFPLIEVGVLELNRNPENYFAEVEQASFSPANVVPGISHSPDKMLQFRIFSYADAHRYRLGANYESLPVNAPRCPVHNYHRDGAMRFDGNGGASVNYEPNSFNGPKEDHRFKEPPLPIEGAADRYDHRAGNDDYTQPGNLFRLMSPAQREGLMDAIAGAMAGVPEFIQRRQIGHFAKADPAYGAGVARRLGLELKGAAE